MNLLTRIITSVFILLVTGLLSPVISHGQAVLRKDTSTDIVLRKMSVNTLDSLRNDKAFIYDTQSKRVLSAWDRFWMWFWNEVGEIMQRKGYKLGFKILLWTLAVGITLYALVRIFGMEKFVLWMKSDKSNLLEGEVADDNIYGVDFDNEINTAEKKQAYREAVRWLYLKSLRVLADHSLINWNINKTNIEYAHELAGTSFGEEFQQLTRYYEYAWYGEFNLNSDDYRKVLLSFDRFNKSVTS